jgi:hypothetical protein
MIMNLTIAAQATITEQIVSVEPDMSCTGKHIAGAQLLAASPSSNTPCTLPLIAVTAASTEEQPCQPDTVRRKPSKLVPHNDHSTRTQQLDFTNCRMPLQLPSVRACNVGEVS